MNNLKNDNCVSKNKKISSNIYIWVDCEFYLMNRKVKLLFNWNNIESSKQSTTMTRPSSGCESWVLAGFRSHHSRVLIICLVLAQGCASLDLHPFWVDNHPANNHHHKNWLVTVNVIKIKQPRFSERCNSWVFDAARIRKIRGTTQ